MKTLALHNFLVTTIHFTANMFLEQESDLIFGCWKALNCVFLDRKCPSNVHNNDIHIYVNNMAADKAVLNLSPIFQWNIMCLLLILSAKSPLEQKSSLRC